jgi:phosphomannomutase
LGAIEGRDDPLYTALVLSAWLAQGGHKLADLVDALPAMYMTEDIRVALPSDEIGRIIAVCGEGLAGATPEAMDGVRLVWPDGWVLARRSITEPKITVRLEGETPAALHRIGAVFGREFPALSDHTMRAITKALAAD